MANLHKLYTVFCLSVAAKTLTFYLKLIQSSRTGPFDCLGAFGVSFAILYMASSTSTGRKKREDNSISGHIMDVLWEGK